MWQAAVGVLIGYLFALWWVRRGARKEVNAVHEMFTGRLEARGEEIISLRSSLDGSQRAVADYERRARYLESAITTAADQSATASQDASAPPATPVTRAG